jgi:multidrug efflux pump subunit AcrA (membrane-fusion protein)
MRARLMQLLSFLLTLIPCPVRDKARSLWAINLAPEPGPIVPEPEPVDPAAPAQLAEMQREKEAADARIAQLEQSIAENVRKRQAYERTLAVGRALDQYTFVTPAARRMAADALLPLMKHAADGAIIAGENEPLGLFIKGYLSERTFLLTQR